ncbi:MAG: isoprenylcysteine carboxylmethyltransferase family protein [Paracoccaceae bacterium]
MKWLDLPPVWLAAFLSVAWGIARLLPGLTVDAVWLRWLGVAIVVAGLGLMVLAIRQMAKHRTTVIPHRQPSALVSTGIFRISRNPIYLGDALILTGAILWWGAVVALPLIPVFIWLIGHRFISPEEARLRTGFGEDFVEWSERTRRWL